MPDLRQMRYFAEVAGQRNITRAATKLHIAQQALSQQIKAMEDMVGGALLDRRARPLELTPAGKVFLVESRRVLAAHDRAIARTLAAARGEIGTLRLAYTLTTAYETLPTLLAALHERHPQLKAECREVFAGDINPALLEGRFDIGLAPRAPLPDGLAAQPIRSEPLAALVGEHHPLAARHRIALAELRNETFELWPREMAPGFYDAIVAACRAANFEPAVDEAAGGSTVWGHVAQGRGIAVTVASAAVQLPRGIVVLELDEPTPTLTIDALWRPDIDLPATRCFSTVAKEVRDAHRWLARKPPATTGDVRTRPEASSDHPEAHAPA
jgi:DNA-binding transcriptional LysR family regulator